MVRAQRLSIVHFASFDLRHSIVLRSIIDYTAIIIHMFAHVGSYLLPKLIFVFTTMSILFASESLDRDRDG
jgi:hypothetical protein